MKSGGGDGKKKILLALNDDGYGPLTFGFFMARAFLRDHPNVDLTIRRGGRPGHVEEFEGWIRRYSGSAGHAASWKGVFAGVQRVDNLISVPKRDGAVDGPSMIQALRSYARRRLEYLACPLESDWDLIVDFGVPVISALSARACIRRFTIFDHGWGLSLDRIARECGANLSDKELRDAIEAIRKDESLTEMAYLFPPFLTPEEFQRHWVSLDVPVKIIPKVFGTHGPLDEVKEQATMSAKFGIPDGQKTVLISGGGTGVWDKIVPEIIKALLQQEDLNYNVLAFVGDDAIRELLPDWSAPVQPVQPVDFVQTRSRWVKLLRMRQELIYQDIIDGVTLILTRAGGATVNDAIARHVPLLLIPEPGHWQVEKIREAVESMGLAFRSGIAFGDLQDPRKVTDIINKHIQDEKELSRLRMNMESIEGDGESWFVEQMMALL